MSVRFSIEAIGVKEFKTQLKKFANETTTIIQGAALAETAAKISATAKSHLPNRWLLRKAIGRKTLRNKKGEGLAIVGIKRGYKKREGGDPALYGRYHEHGYFVGGNRITQGRHFLKRAYEQHQSTLETVMYYRLQRALEREIRGLK